VSRELSTGLSAELRDILEPLLKEIESLNERIQEYDERMEKIARESYPQVALLKQVKGVGTQIALFPFAYCPRVSTKLFWSNDNTTLR